MEVTPQCQQLRTLNPIKASIVSAAENCEKATKQIKATDQEPTDVASCGGDYA